MSGLRCVYWIKKPGWLATMEKLTLTSLKQKRYIQITHLISNKCQVKASGKISNNT